MYKWWVKYMELAGGSCTRLAHNGGGDVAEGGPGHAGHQGHCSGEDAEEEGPDASGDLRPRQD